MLGGIIPTRVGTSIRVKICSAVTRDHPHACGDKLSAIKPFVNLVGSSPRVWGQVTEDNYTFALTGIIPTRVGTSVYRIIFCCNSWDHPHACGDKLTIVFLAEHTQGSSPRVWGQENCIEKRFSLRRIIPTRVGTRYMHFPTAQSNRDHPHACGDKRILHGVN